MTDDAYNFNVPQYAESFEELIKSNADNGFFNVKHTPENEKKKRSVKKESENEYKFDEYNGDSTKISKQNGKRLSIKRTGSPLVNEATEYISLENTFHLQNDLPLTPKSCNFQTDSENKEDKLESKPLSITMPKTPVLLTSKRVRPLPPSQEDVVLQEIENFNKTKNLPLPLNRKILDNPYELTYSKQFTVPQPFNLTDVQHKREVASVKPYLFKAESDENKQPTIGTGENELNDSSIKTEPRRTIVKPFTFDKRIKEAEKRKKDRILEIYGKEKKMREFKARPMPSFLKYLSPNSASSSIASSHYSCLDNNDFHPEFKARTPMVLKKKPFIAQKPQRLLKPLQIELNTELRSKERADFDEEKKKRLEISEEIKKNLQEEEKAAEEENISLQRKQLVHKPLKLPKFYSDKES